MGSDVDDRLEYLRENISALRTAFASITEISKHAEAHGMHFAGLMLQEALDSFEKALIAYTDKRRHEVT